MDRKGLKTGGWKDRKGKSEMCIRDRNLPDHHDRTGKKVKSTNHGQAALTVFSSSGKMCIRDSLWQSKSLCISEEKNLVINIFGILIGKAYIFIFEATGLDNIQ